MKIILKGLCFIFVMGLSIGNIFSQSFILKNFSLSQIEESVFLRWTILEGETCNGIKIHRSTDSLNFQLVGDIAGVCGSPDFAQPFEFVDPHPVKNKTNFYKLELGNTGFSAIRSIDVISLNDEGVLVLPNPATKSTTIYFQNEYNSPHSFRLYSATGKLILEIRGRAKSFALNTSNLEAGIYIFTISAKGESSGAGGKISIVH